MLARNSQQQSRQAFRYLGFNGAARLLARKSGGVSPHSCKVYGFNGAARLLARKCRMMGTESLVLAAASMGPRDCSRGNPKREWNDGVYWRLQWGRAIARAEICQSRQCVHVYTGASLGPRDCSRGNRGSGITGNSNISCFNGAARLLARKSTPDGAVSGRTCRASMGPRDCSRGNRTRHYMGAWLENRFNGAARLLARK